jgi:choline/ethanolamine kinase
MLYRIYGQGVDIFFDRADEVRTFECMSHLPPRLIRQRLLGGVHQRQV